MSTFDSSDKSDDASLIARIISLIDLTDLDDAHRPEGVGAVLEDAARYGTAAVCLWPEFVEQAAGELTDSDVRIATVANFPAGVGSQADVVADVRLSLAAGADEIDLVLPWRSLLDGDRVHAANVVRAVADLVHDSRGALLKVILETGDLADPSAIADASVLAVENGADFLKTSTGKTDTGATLEAVAVMLDVIADAERPIGIKPSGGVRSVADAIALLDLATDRFGDDWAVPKHFRFGASGLLAEAVAAIERT